MYQPDIDRLQEFWRTLQDMWIKLYGMNQVTIAAINVRQLWQQGFWVSVSSINGLDLIISAGWIFFQAQSFYIYFFVYVLLFFWMLPANRQVIVEFCLSQGHSPAGGCLMSISCDYRIMAPNYSIGLNETQLVWNIQWGGLEATSLKQLRVWTHLLIKYFFLILNPLSDSCSTT